MLKTTFTFLRWNADYLMWSRGSLRNHAHCLSIDELVAFTAATSGSAPERVGRALGQHYSTLLTSTAAWRSASPTSGMTLLRMMVSTKIPADKFVLNAALSAARQWTPLLGANEATELVLLCHRIGGFPPTEILLLSIDHLRAQLESGLCNDRTIEDAIKVGYVLAVLSRRTEQVGSGGFLDTHVESNEVFLSQGDLFTVTLLEVLSRRSNPKLKSSCLEKDGKIHSELSMTDESLAQMIDDVLAESEKEKDVPVNVADNLSGCSLHSLLLVSEMLFLVPTPRGTHSPSDMHFSWEAASNNAITFITNSIQMKLESCSPRPLKLSTEQVQTKAFEELLEVIQVLNACPNFTSRWPHHAQTIIAACTHRLKRMLLGTCGERTTLFDVGTQCDSERLAVVMRIVRLSAALRRASDSVMSIDSSLEVDEQVKPLFFVLFECLHHALGFSPKGCMTFIPPPLPPLGEVRRMNLLPESKNRILFHLGKAFSGPLASFRSNNMNTMAQILPNELCITVLLQLPEGIPLLLLRLYGSFDNKLATDCAVALLQTMSTAQLSSIVTLLHWLSWDETLIRPNRYKFPHSQLRKLPAKLCAMQRDQLATSVAARLYLDARSLSAAQAAMALRAFAILKRQQLYNSQAIERAFVAVHQHIIYLRTGSTIDFENDSVRSYENRKGLKSVDDADFFDPLVGPPNVPSILAKHTDRSAEMLGLIRSPKERWPDKKKHPIIDKEHSTDSSLSSNTDLKQQSLEGRRRWLAAELMRSPMFWANAPTPPS